MALLQVAPELSVNFDIEIVTCKGEFARAASERGITVRTIGDDYRNLGLGATRHSAFSGKLAGLKALVSLFFHIRREISDGRPDVVYCNTLRMCVVGGVVGKIYRIPVIWHVRDSLSFPYMSRFMSAVLRVVLQKTASDVISNSQYTARQLNGISSTVVGSPISNEFFSAVPDGRKVSSAENFVMVGRFAPWKGQLETVQAFALAFPRGDQRLVLVGGPLFGESAYLELVRQEAVLLGVADRVEFLGHSDDVATLMRAARAVVHASTLPEPLGQVTIQASALGRPLIVANAGGPADLFEDEVTAKMHTAGDVESLASAMRWIFDDRSQSEAMGVRARAVAEPFRLDAIVPQTEAVVLRTFKPN